ncbi:MFS transporter [Lentzea aerocolonigenes]|uniref:MFS transporter n=1 Tax=Lentzea aerocolonigenes TaxID=68170 RepID=UPI0006960F7D|nr:MFS transporter [Lentzea aerocolonigenes]
MRDFRFLWTGRAVSLLGSWLLVVAVPAHMYAVTGSVFAAGATLAAECLPVLMLGPLAGVLVDRWDRRRAMIAADLFRATAVAAMLIGTPAAIYLALVAESVGAVVFRPAAQAHVPAVVGPDGLAAANSWNATTDGVVRLAGPTLGGVLFAWAGFEAVIALDVASYLISATAIAFTASRPIARTPDGPATKTPPLVRRLLPLTGVFLAANAALSALLVPFGMNNLGGSAQVGTVLSALGIGFLGGAVLVRWLDRIQLRTVLATAQLATAGGFVLLFNAKDLTSAMVAAVVIGMFGSVTVVAPQTAVQRRVENHRLGRISAIFLTVEAAATLIGAIAGPWLAESVSLHVAAMTAAAITATSAVVGAVTVPRVMLAAKRSNEQADDHARTR